MNPVPTKRPEDLDATGYRMPAPHTSTPTTYAAPARDVASGPAVQPQRASKSAWSANNPTWQRGQSGYDPRNPARQGTYSGDGDLGANNGFNLGNMWQMTYDQMRRTQGDMGQWDTRRQGSRAASDATRNSWQAPGYQAPNAYSWDQQRAPIGSDADLESSVNRYRSIMDTSGSGGGPVASRDAQATDAAGMGSAFYDYANAGANILQTRMKDEHRTLTDNAAGRGRLNTGFFDEDRGQLWRQLGSEAQDSINSNALAAARLDQDAALQNARGRTDVDVGNADRSLKGAMYNRDADTDDSRFLLDFAAGREDTRGARGDERFESDRDFDYGVYGDARDFGRNTFENDRNFGRGAYESDRDFDESRYRFDEGGYGDARDSYLNQVTGARDWREGRLQQQQAEGGGGWLGNLAGAVGGAALGPIGAMAGQYVGGKLFGGGGGGAQGAGTGPAAPKASASVQSSGGGNPYAWGGSDTSWASQRFRNSTGW